MVAFENSCKDEKNSLFFFVSRSETRRNGPAWWKGRFRLEIFQELNTITDCLETAVNSSALEVFKNIARQTSVKHITGVVDPV